MALDNFERMIMAELKIVTGNRKLTGKNFMEWSTGKIKAHEGEKIIKLPQTRVWVAYTE